MARYKVILNPTSGSGKGERAIDSIRRLFEKNRLDYDLTTTEKPWHAVEITVDAVKSGFEIIVAAGGDGTVNEVINGLMQAKELDKGEASLGVLCVGRGNDFAGGVGIPSNLDQAIQVLAVGQKKRIDIGQVFAEEDTKGRYFGNCVGVGFDAMGTIQVAKLPRLGGILSYLIAIIQTIFIYYKAPLIRVEYAQESIRQRSLLVSIMNGHRLGGGFLMAPNADLTDGLFDFCIASDAGKARIFALIPHFLRGTQATQPEIKTSQGSEIRITAIEGTLPVQTDGEILCVDGKSIHVKMHPHQLDVITSP